MALSNTQIFQISNKLFPRLHDIMSYFEIEYEEHPNRLSFACPIHGGDNPMGCSIFTDGNTSKGNWACWTQHCEEDYSKSLFGFVRGALANKLSKEVDIYTAYAFCLKFLNLKAEDIPNTAVETNNEIKILETFERSPLRETPKISRDEIVQSIAIPSTYYINRGYQKETLVNFDIGMCNNKNKPMSGRIVVPIYDEDYNYVGCIGRASTDWMKPKWLHSKGFRKSAYLYGMNIAKEEILKTGTAVLVEGQGDVWRMHEAGIKNCVGIFGASLSDEQLVLLEQSGALNLVILTDTDEAGERAAEQIVKKGGRRFNYYRPDITEKDIGEMTIEQIKEQIINELEGVL